MQETQKNKKEADPAPKPPKSTVILLLVTVADTTWRLFVPAIGGTVLGLLSDKAFGTTPLLTVFGIVFGAVLAFWLVYMQLTRVRKQPGPHREEA